MKESAEEVVKDIRRATRRHFSAEDKIRIVLEGLRGEESIVELCRREGIVQNLYYLSTPKQKSASGPEEVQASLRLGHWPRRASSAPAEMAGFRGRGGHGFQETEVIPPVSGLTTAASSSAGWASRRRLAVDCFSR